MRPQRAQRNSQIMNVVSFVTSATTRYGSQSAASDSTREPRSFGCSNSLRPSAASCSKQFLFSPRVWIRFQDSEQKVAESAEKNAAQQELRPPVGAASVGVWPSRRGRDRQVTANCPMLGRDNFSHYRGCCPNVLDRVLSIRCPINTVCPTDTVSHRQCPTDREKSRDWRANAARRARRLCLKGRWLMRQDSDRRRLCTKQRDDHRKDHKNGPAGEHDHRFRLFCVS
jgi:hypothetical protein